LNGDRFAQGFPPAAGGVSGSLIANVTGRLWAAGLQLVFTPVYIRLLGPEAYGLIGFYTTLVVALGFLDQAVSPVLVREFARLSVNPGRMPDMRNLLRTLETITVMVGVVLGAAVFLFAPLIATLWLKYQTLPADEVVLAVRLMGLGLACQWPSLLYSGGYVGLVRQGVLTRLRIAGMTVQWAGAALVLWASGSRVEAFFAWQALSLALISAMLGVGLWRLLPEPSHRPRAALASVRGVRRYAAGTFLIGLTASILTQADKLIVSSAVPLDRFAAYSLCFMLMMLISSFIAAPMAASLLPHFTRLAAKSDDGQLALEYHRWTQLLVVAALPVCGVFVIFGRPLLETWLAGRGPLVDEIMPLLPWATLGTLLNIVMLMPLLLQLAAGWTRLSVIKNVIAVALVLPILLLGVPRFGPIVGAWCWFGLNFAYYLVEVPLVHRRLLRGEMRAWWIRDTLCPGIIAAAFFWAVARLSSALQDRPIEAIAAAAASGLVSAALLALALPHPRAMIMEVSRRVARSWKQRRAKNGA